jgi:phosphoribosylformimino-5-aminoimidazole carboxamide ribotide isomerase
LCVVARSLKVIPVIDILNGEVVHAVRGKRKEYKPLQSVLTTSTSPAAVAKTFRELGFSELYVADLDAIVECTDTFQQLKQIADESGLKLMVDAGVTSVARAQKLLESGVEKLVVGTETLGSRGFVAEAARRFGGGRVVLSLDMRGEAVVVGAGFNGCTEAMCLLREFADAGVSQFIVLDLLRVGSGEGVNLDFLRRVRTELPAVEVYVGGGVRGVADLLELKKLGVAGALVATALHKGKISVKDLQQSGLL